MVHDPLVKPLGVSDPSHNQPLSTNSKQNNTVTRANATLMLTLFPSSHRFAIADLLEMGILRVAAVISYPTDRPTLQRRFLKENRQ